MYRTGYMHILYCPIHEYHHMHAIHAYHILSILQIDNSLNNRRGLFFSRFCDTLFSQVLIKKASIAFRGLFAKNSFTHRKEIFWVELTIF